MGVSYCSVVLEHSFLNVKFMIGSFAKNMQPLKITGYTVDYSLTPSQEKMRGRNKLVPRLLGISRKSIMRVDENSKDVLKTWPLTTIRRWAASPNSFTLVSGRAYPQK